MHAPYVRPLFLFPGPSNRIQDKPLRDCNLLCSLIKLNRSKLKTFYPYEGCELDRSRGEQFIKSSLGQPRTYIWQTAVSTALFHPNRVSSRCGGVFLAFSSRESRDLKRAACPVLFCCRVARAADLSYIAIDVFPKCGEDEESIEIIIWLAYRCSAPRDSKRCPHRGQSHLEECLVSIKLQIYTDTCFSAGEKKSRPKLSLNANKKKDAQSYHQTSLSLSLSHSLCPL